MFNPITAHLFGRPFLERRHISFTAGGDSRFSLFGDMIVGVKIDK